MERVVVRSVLGIRDRPYGTRKHGLTGTGIGFLGENGYICSDSKPCNVKNFWLTGLILWAWGCAPQPKQPQMPAEILVCGDQTALIVDAARSDSAHLEVVWQWEVKDAMGQIPYDLLPRFRNVDECKFVDEGYRVLITCGAGGVALLDRATRNCMFYAYAPLAHSADLLPNGRIAVALSLHEQGNAIQLYEIGKPDQVLFRDTLYSGHGSVWLDSLRRYYALGFDELREYSLQDWNTSSPKLKRERSWKIPGEGGHDLSAVSNEQLLVTDHEGVYLFDIEKETFTPFEPLMHTPHVKAVNYDPVSGSLVYTKAEEEWWTHHVYCVDPDRVLRFPQIKVYKARTRPLYRCARMP